MKPNIDDVRVAMQKFFIANQKNIAENPVSKWMKEFEKNRNILKADFEKFGLAEHIDWDYDINANLTEDGRILGFDEFEIESYNEDENGK